MEIQCWVGRPALGDTLGIKNVIHCTHYHAPAGNCNVLCKWPQLCSYYEFLKTRLLRARKQGAERRHIFHVWFVCDHNKPIGYSNHLKKTYNTNTNVYDIILYFIKKKKFTKGNIAPDCKFPTEELYASKKVVQLEEINNTPFLHELSASQVGFSRNDSEVKMEPPSKYRKYVYFRLNLIFISWTRPHSLHFPSENV